MLDRTLFAGETYRQTGNYCVMASYAVAMKPFLVGTGVDVCHFFEGYCKEMLLCRSRSFRAALAEKLYLSDFLAKTSLEGFKSGYEVIFDLHQFSNTSPFREARARVNVLPCQLPQNLGSIEDALRGQTRAVAIVFVNGAIAIPGDAASAWAVQKCHSVVLGCDNAGFYIYDVNHGQGTVSIRDTVRILESADCLLFVEN